MTWTVPQYSRRKVDEAGQRIVNAYERGDYTGFIDAIDVINNWRSAHSFPLNTFQNGLRKKGRRVDPECVVAQRVKRLFSIEAKLTRFPGLRLSQIQDIGGCRVVLHDVEKVRELVAIYRSSDLKHTLARVDDYMERPQSSGYRGAHLIYKYVSDKNTVFNGLKIEVQIRSQYQHAWATAVETVGTFLRQSLKSSMGEDAWLRFFALMGTAIAFIESTQPDAGTPSDWRDLVDEIKGLQDSLDITSRLQLYGQALQLFEGEAQRADADFFLIVLDPVVKRVLVKGFARSELGRAQQELIEVEKRTADTPSDAVLVSVDSVAALQKAYPNYFLDTRVFVSLLGSVTSGSYDEYWL